MHDTTNKSPADRFKSPQSDKRIAFSNGVVSLPGTDYNYHSINLGFGPFFCICGAEAEIVGLSPKNRAFMPLKVRGPSHHTQSRNVSAEFLSVRP